MTFNFAMQAIDQVMVVRFCLLVFGWKVYANCQWSIYVV